MEINKGYYGNQLPSSWRDFLFGRDTSLDIQMKVYEFKPRATQLKVKWTQLKDETNYSIKAVNP
jgi:hypothetical protein